MRYALYAEWMVSKMEHITLSVEREIRDELERRANKLGISLNQLMSNIIRRFIETDKESFA